MKFSHTVNPSNVLWQLLFIAGQLDVRCKCRHGRLETASQKEQAFSQVSFRLDAAIAAACVGFLRVDDPACIDRVYPAYIPNCEKEGG